MSQEEEIAAIETEVAALKREIISFGDDLDAIKVEVAAVDREYRAAQAENQYLLEQLRTGSNNLDPIAARIIGVQLASILVYLGSLTNEITLEGKKVRLVSQKMFAKEAKIQQLEQKQIQLRQQQQQEKAALEQAVAEAENLLKFAEAECSRLKPREEEELEEEDHDGDITAAPATAEFVEAQDCDRKKSASSEEA